MMHTDTISVMKEMARPAGKQLTRLKEEEDEEDEEAQESKSQRSGVYVLYSCSKAVKRKTLVQKTKQSIYEWNVCKTAGNVWFENANANGNGNGNGKTEKVCFPPVCTLCTLNTSKQLRD